MRETAFHELLLEKFPDFDATWSDNAQKSWFAGFQKISEIMFTIEALTADRLFALINQQVENLCLELIAEYAKSYEETIPDICKEYVDERCQKLLQKIKQDYCGQAAIPTIVVTDDTGHRGELLGPFPIPDNTATVDKRPSVVSTEATAIPAKNTAQTPDPTPKEDAGQTTTHETGTVSTDEPNTNESRLREEIASFVNQLFREKPNSLPWQINSAVVEQFGQDAVINTQTLENWLHKLKNGKTITYRPPNGLNYLRDRPEIVAYVHEQIQDGKSDKEITASISQCFGKELYISQSTVNRWRNNWAKKAGKNNPPDNKTDLIAFAHEHYKNNPRCAARQINQAIAAQFGKEAIIDHKTLARWMQKWRYGLTVKTRPATRSYAKDWPDLASYVQKELLAGEKDQEIAEKIPRRFGNFPSISQSTIATWRKQWTAAGLPIPPVQRGGNRKNVTKQICQNLSVAEPSTVPADENTPPLAQKTIEPTLHAPLPPATNKNAPPKPAAALPAIHATTRSPAPKRTTKQYRDWFKLASTSDLHDLTPCDRPGVGSIGIETCLQWQYLWRVTRHGELPIKTNECATCSNWIQEDSQVKQLIGIWNTELKLDTEDEAEPPKRGYRPIRQRIATPVSFGKNRPEGPHGMLLSIGNSKVGNDTLTLNMGAALDCPSAKLGLCMVKKRFPGAQACFSQNAEQQFSNVLERRHQQEQYWRHTPTELMLKDIDAIMSTLDKQNKEIKYFRFNEACDFWNQESVQKADEIAKHLITYGVTSYCNTSRSDLNFANLNLLVRGSGWKGPNGETRVILKDEPIPKNFHVCPMNCKICTLCKLDYSDIIYYFHGPGRPKKEAT